MKTKWTVLLADGHRIEVSADYAATEHGTLVFYDLPANKNQYTFNMGNITYPRDILVQALPTGIWISCNRIAKDTI